MQPSQPSPVLLKRGLTSFNSEHNMDEKNSNEAFQPPSSQAISVPVAEVTMRSPSGDDIRYQAYSVKRPAQDVDDFLIECRASVLERCRSQLNRIVDSEFPLYEIMLAISCAATGAFLGALPTDITHQTSPLMWKFYFAIVPLVGSSLLVAYFLLRRNEVQSATRIAKAVLADLPDPCNTK